MSDPLALDHTWLLRADDCIVTDQLKLRRARGFTRRTTAAAITGAYSTQDFKRLYLVDDGDLVQILPDLSRRVLATGLASAPMRFAEMNGVVYAANGTDYLTIDNQGASNWGIAPPRAPGNLIVGSGVLAAGFYRVTCTLTDAKGRESGNGDIAAIEVPDGSAIGIMDVPQVAGFTTSVYVTGPNDAVFHVLARAVTGGLTYSVAHDDLGEELPFLFANQPHGVLPAAFAGRMYLADPYPRLDVSAIWRSFPLQYHLFDDGSEGASVPGTVLMHAACDAAIIIGTERAIYSLDEDGKLDMLAPYGVVPGDHATLHRGQLYFWTQRGACRALPFENLTESAISVAPGTRACAAVIEQDGYRRYMVALHVGGAAFNPYKRA